MASAVKIPLVKSADPLDDGETGRLLSKDSIAKDQLHKEQIQLESRVSVCGLPVQVVAGICYCIGAPISWPFPPIKGGKQPCSSSWDCAIDWKAISSIFC